MKMNNLHRSSKIFIAGHNGMVGSAIVRYFRESGFDNLLVRNREALDLCDQSSVATFFADEKPEIVFLAAARVGGIAANQKYPAEFIYQNLQIQNNVIHSSWKTHVDRLVFFSSSCVYPKQCQQPMKEKYLLSGYLESTHEPFAVAKLAGMSMCQAYNKQYGTKFMVVMPPNLYGPNDNFDLNNSHLLSALISRFHTGKVENSPGVTLWGTGAPRRELMYVDDVVDAVMFLLENYNDLNPINIGINCDNSVKEIAEIVKDVVGFKGKILFDTSKPDGVAQKLLDSSRIQELGWKAKTPLIDGIVRTYEWYRKMHDVL